MEHRSPTDPRPPAGGRAIKGPKGRFKHDVRRVWQCPACGRRAWTGGNVVNRLCPCGAGEDPPRPTWMRLVEEPRPAPQASQDGVE
jgi:hypothetical protein